MCWKIKEIEFNKNPESYHKVAEEDITVYKFGYAFFDEFLPAFHLSFSYNANVLNSKEDISCKKCDDYIIIEEGYHSYSMECSLYHIHGSNLFYAFLLDGFLSGPYTATLYIGEFIIPKGTEYYENEKGEIVSPKIIWNGHLEDLSKFGNKEKAIKFSDI